MQTIRQILDIARWAPSGDNCQPWRFEIVSEMQLVVHISEVRDLYDLEGWATQIAVGTLLENIRLAASAHGLRTEARRKQGTLSGRLQFEVDFVPEPGLETNALLPFVEARTVHRRPLSPRPLTASEKHALEQSLGSDFEAHWLEGWRGRLGVARLTSANGRLRYRMYEGFEVHRKIIAPNARFSEDRIPDRAIGLDPVTTRLMMWALRDWRRIEFLNDYLGGTLLPTLELDFMPGLLCAAHALIVARTEPRGVDDYVHAGRAVQRFWLTATSLGIMMQPETTPLIFASYAEHGVAFSKLPGATEAAERIGVRLRRIFGEMPVQRSVFMCRLGHGRKPKARSLRRSVEALLLQQSPERR